MPRVLASKSSFQVQTWRHKLVVYGYVTMLLWVFLASELGGKAKSVALLAMLPVTVILIDRAPRLAAALFAGAAASIVPVLVSDSDFAAVRRIAFLHDYGRSQWTIFLVDFVLLAIAAWMIEPKTTRERSAAEPIMLQTSDRPWD